MDLAFRDKFSELWARYFPNAELPLTFYYAAGADRAELVKPGTVSRCVIGALVQVRNGRSFTFNAESIGCFGGRRYLGFAEKPRPDFEYFLSCGIPGKMEGERYKKSPELVKEVMKHWPSFKSPTPYIVFKRWDHLDADDQPEVVIFFARPDVLAGLFTLASYDESRPDAVICPMGSGCSAIVANPYREKDAEFPRAVIGMFDPSARPYVPRDALTFSVPMKRFEVMVANMAESFLTTESWAKISRRMAKTD